MLLQEHQKEENSSANQSRVRILFLFQVITVLEMLYDAFIMYAKANIKCSLWQMPHQISVAAKPAAVLSSSEQVRKKEE